MRAAQTPHPHRFALPFRIVAVLVFTSALGVLCGCQETIDSPPSPIEQTYASIPLDEETFPDTMVRNYLSHYYDADGSGALDNGEAEEIYELGVPSLYEDNSYEKERAENFPAPTTLQGLELLPSLTAINVDASNLGAISLDGFDSLLTFRASATSADVPAITSIDTSGCPSLKALHLTGGCFTSLDLSSNTELTDFSYYEFNYLPQRLESLVIPSSLVRTSLINVQVPNLDFSQCAELEQLVLTDVTASSINLPDADNLSTLYISDSNLSTLDLKSQSSLVGLYINAPQVSELDLSSQNNLKYLNIKYTSVSQIDLQGSAYVNEEITVPEGCSVLNTACHYGSSDDWPGSGYLPDEVSFSSMTYYVNSTDTN